MSVALAPKLCTVSGEPFSTKLNRPVASVVVMPIQLSPS